ncbi:zinc finger protein 667-like [Athalia rosae]|uniref:zinc finger protein 667-like n=1 Tax=Athalia rosae TaxID=37344 RepID=UPI00203463A8|nr:zinc finger protein 667-like [Athalia rosae]
MNTAVQEWNNACRLCSEVKAEMLSIFGGEGTQRKVTLKMRACFPVMVYKTDPLPKQICQFCAARLDDAYEFRERCLSVYKNMHLQLIGLKESETVQIFLDAMKNSPDPCQAQLCKEKARAPPPLVPLSASLSAEKLPGLTSVAKKQEPNVSYGSLIELPCEVQIKEEPMDLADVGGSHLDSKNIIPDEHLDPIRCEGTEISQKTDKKSTGRVKTERRNLFTNESRLSNTTKSGNGSTSILEQVLTGNLTVNDRENKPKFKLSSKWWCAPCNRYYRTKASLRKHIRLFCPCKYKCKKCSEVFQSVEELARHEGSHHLKVMLNFHESVNKCDQCDREFVSWEILGHHKQKDHQPIPVTEAQTETNTWHSSCNRTFPTLESFQSHRQPHQPDMMPPLPATSAQFETLFDKNPFMDNIKSLTCPTCGKVCTQQSALSNHMRTHEPKKHKCEICGRSFGLFIRLAAHRLSEHNQQPIMSPIMASVEQEEALNAEREAREAREVGETAGGLENYSKESDDEGLYMDDLAHASMMSGKHSNVGRSKNVARCGICLQWFNDHTTMLTHLQTHSESYVSKNFSCRICKKMFKEKWQFQRHEASHKRANKITLYTCSTCKKTFKDKALHKAHEVTHVVDKTYHCPRCNKIFFKEVSLVTHQCVSGKPTFGKRGSNSKTASKGTLNFGAFKKYKCSKCNATFNNSQSRNSHMRVHTQAHAMLQMRKKELKRELEMNKAVPNLKSEEESPGTSLPAVMEPLVEVNVEDSPVLPAMKRTLITTGGGYRCGVCQSPFVLRELAVAHLRSAHPAATFHCQHCKKQFSTRYTLARHVETVHPNESEK